MPARHVQDPRVTWRVAAQVDGRVAVLIALATALTSGALFWTRFVPVSRWSAFALVSPLVGAGFFIATLLLFLARRRHGGVRGLLVGGAAVLAVAGSLFAPAVGLAWVIVCYWTPAVVALVAAGMLHHVRHLQVRPLHRPREV